MPADNIKAVALPRGWRWVALGNTCEINPRRPKEFDRADDKPTTFIPMDAVSAIYGVVDKPQTRPYEETKKGYTFFSDGDVLFAKITPCMQNGKHFIAAGSLDGVGFASTEFHVLRPGDSLLAEWAHFYLRQPAILKEATYHFTGTVGQQRVPDSFLKKLSIPLPPLAEQKRIVAVLNRKMAAVEKARVAALERVEAVQSLPAAWLREVFAFGGEGLPRGWRWVALGDVADYVNGKAFKPEEWQSSGLPIVRIQNLNNASASYNYYPGNVQDRYLIKDGDLLVSWSASLDAFIWNRGDAILNQHIFKVVENPSLVEREFLYVSIKSAMDTIKGQIHGATMQHITKPAFESVKIPLPPLAQQKRLIASLNAKMAATEKTRAAAEVQLEAITALPAALLREAFGGAL